jgi:hypothetical protein
MLSLIIDVFKCSYRCIFSHFVLSSFFSAFNFSLLIIFLPVGYLNTSLSFHFELRVGFLRLSLCMRQGSFFIVSFLFGELPLAILLA